MKYNLCLEDLNSGDQRKTLQHCTPIALLDFTPGKYCVCRGVCVCVCVCVHVRARVHAQSIVNYILIILISVYLKILKFTVL